MKRIALCYYKPITYWCYRQAHYVFNQFLFLVALGGANVTNSSMILFPHILREAKESTRIKKYLDVSTNFAPATDIF